MRYHSGTDTTFWYAGLGGLSKMKKLSLILTALLTVFAASEFSVAQTTTSAARPYVLEVTYFRGRPIAYERIGNTGVFALFERVPAWKPTAEVPAVTGVVIASHYDGKTVRLKVACRDVKEPDNAFPVGEYSIAEDGRTSIKELTKCGIVPFEIAIVRAPIGVAELPNVVNKTNSLQISVEPNESSLPSFNLVVMNNSPKPVLGFSFQTLMGGKPIVSGMPFNLNGAVLLAPGESIVKTLPSEVKLTNTSNGEIPETQAGLEVRVSSVTFADRTYEGSPSDANSLIALKAGEKSQVKRILELLRSKPNSIDGLLTAFSQLSTDVDEADFKGFIASRPTLSQNEVVWARKSFETAAKRVQKIFSDELNTAGNRNDFQKTAFLSWISSAEKRFEQWFTALP